jgi:autotransporter-associated beta strand protein
MNFASRAGRLAVTDTYSNTGHRRGAGLRWFAAPVAAVAALVLFTAPAARGQIILNNSSFDITPVADTSTAGISGRQFLSTGNDTQRIDFTQTANSIRLDPSLNYLDNTVLPPGNAIQWLGMLNIDTAGNYQFGSSSDDGSRLWIDGVLVIQNDGAKGNSLGTSAGIDLSAGLHDVRVDYINGVTGAAMVLSMNGSPITSNLFAAQSNTLAGASNAVIIGGGTGQSLSVTGNSTLNLNGSAFTQAQLGSATFASGSSLSLVTTAGVNGKALRIAGPTTFGTGVTLNLVGDGTIGSNLYLDGALSDGGVATTITKTGNGLLFLDNTTSANSLVAGSLVDVQGGTLTLVGSGAAGAFNPLGAAGIRLSGGNMVLDSKVGSPTFNNAISVTADGTIQTITNTSTTTLSGGLSVAATKTLTLDAIAGGNPTSSLPATLLISGPLTGSGNINIISTNVGQLTNTPLKGVVALSGVTSGFTGTVNVQTGGILQINNAQSGVTNGSLILNGGTLNLVGDGDGTGQPETLAYGTNVTIASSGSTLSVGRNGTTFFPKFQTASNKTIQINSINSNGQQVTVTNNNGYGLEVTGTSTLSGDQTYSVSTATASNVVQGLTLSGKVTGAFNVTKTGAGTMVLSNATNDFGGAGFFVDIQGGVLSVPSDAALGNAANSIRLDGTTGATTLTGLRATGTFATARSIALVQGNNGTTGLPTNGIEVTGNNTLTINAPFDISTSTSNGLVKNDAGILALTQSNVGWSGPILNNQGAIRVSNNDALGSGSVTVGNALGAALQLTNNVTINNQLFYSITGGAVSSGLNYGGGLESVSGNNTVTNVITQASGSALLLSADAGATLNVTGGVSLVNTLYLGGAGNVNISNQGLNITANSLTKFGTGTATLSSNNSGITVGVNVQGGTLVLNQDAQLGGTSTVTVNSGSTLRLDNTVTNSSNRLNGRPVTLNVGTFQYLGNAAGSSETFGALSTPTGGGNSIISTPSGTGTIALTFASLSQSADSSAAFSGAGLGTASNIISFTTAPTLVPATTGILARDVITTAAGGFDFVSYNNNGATANTNGIQAFTNYNATAGSAANINTAAATDTVNATSAMTTASITASKTINALKITGNGLTVGGAANTTLTLTAAGVAVTGGSNTINVPVLNFAAVQPIFHVDTGSTLNLNSTVFSSAGFVKADGGTLVLTPPANLLGIANATSNIGLTGTHSINGGTVRLGTNNAITANSFLRVTSNGTLDLNGKAQYVQALFNDAIISGAGLSVAGAGGTVTGTTGSLLVANYDNTARQFTGTMTGAMSFVRSGQNTQVLYNNNSYTGNTILNGGTTSLRDDGRLSGTSSLDINYAALTFDNNLTNPTGTKDLADRLNDAAPISLRGGTITLLGRIQSDTRESIGAVSVLDGVNVLDVQAGGTGINSAVLTAASLLHPTGASGVVILGRGSSTIDQNGQIGSTPRMLVTAAPTLTNDIIGPWAIIRRDWASNIGTLGIGQLNANGFAGYSTNTLTGSPLATDNIKITALGTTTTLTQDTTINTLNITTTTTNSNTLLDLGGKKLTLMGGGMMFGLDGNTQTHTVSNGTLTSGYANGTKNDLYVYQGAFGGTDRQLVISAAVVDNGATPVRLIVNSGDAAGNANRTTLLGANTYTGGTVVNQGQLAVGATGVIPSGGVSLNGGALTVLPGGVVNANNTITMNGLSILNYINNNTAAYALAFNNNGGATGPTLNSFVAGQGTNGTGTLTVTGGVTADSSNVGSTSLMQGRFDFGGSAQTITVNPIMVNGVDIAPLQAGLAIQGIVGSAGGINKAGLGTLQLNAQEIFTGPLNVNAGTVTFGALGNTGLSANNAAGSRFSDLNVASGARVNLANDGTIGSLSGAGVVTNETASARTLNTGFDNTSTTFSGQFARFTNGLPNNLQVNKIGSGTMTLTGVSNDTQNMQVSQGGVTFSGAGSATFGTYLVLPTGTLTLDNSGTNVNSRLTGGAASGGTLTVGGGSFVMNGNSGANTTETIGTLNVGLSTGNLYGNSTITLQANAAHTLTLTAGAFGGVPIGSSGLIRGISGTAGNGLANLNLGAVAIGAPTGSGTGANGTTTMGIRPDILGDASATGIGTGFLTKDSATNFLRPLTAAELATSFPSGASTATVNYGLSSMQQVGARTILGSLTLNSGGGVGTIPGVVSANNIGGLPVGIVVNTGGILSLAGSTSSLNVNRLETQNNTAYHFHTQGDLNVNAVLFGTSGGLNKGDTGTLTLSARNLYTGQTQINNGKLVLNGGDNTLPLLITAGAPGTTAIGVNAPGATIDLNGTNQITGTFNNNQSQRYAGGGGILTNSSTTTSNYTSISGSAQVFGGSITGNLNFTKTGNNSLAFSNVNTYTGTTNIRANTLTLIDTGALTNTSSVNLFYSGLNIDQSGLNPLINSSPARLPAAAPVNLMGGTLTLTSGGSADSTQTVGTLNLVQSHNTVSVPQAPVSGLGALTINNLVRANNPDATVNFTGGAGGFFSNSPGLNQSQLFINAIDGVAIPAVIPNKILGGWAVANNGEFVTYVSPGTTGSNGINWGVITMNGTTGPLGTITQDLYDSNAATFPVSNPNSNVRISGTGTINLPNGNTNYNVVAIRAAATAINFSSSSDVLNLTAGGLALTNGGTTVGQGILTAGGTPTDSGGSTVPLYVYSNGNSNTINATIADNTAGSGNKVRLVVTAIANTLNLGASNTYTGGTAINGGGGSVTLNGPGTTIPAGGLTLNNVTLTMTNNGGQIDATNDVILNGGSTLTLVNSNTLNSLKFNNTGGTATPTVAVGTSALALTSVDAITAVNDNAATVPTISGSQLTLPDGANIKTSTTAFVPTDLVISAAISTSGGGAINKTGTGSLDLSGANSFNGLNLNAGTLMLGNNSALGGGTLTMADGTALMSDTAIRTITNPVVINGNVTFGSLSGANGSAVAVNGVIINSSTVDLGAGAARTINVNSQLNVTTIGSAVSGAGSSIIKTGPGTLALTGSNSFDGGITINGGILQSGASGLGSGIVKFGGGILQHAAATTTDFSAQFSTANNQPIYIDTNNQTITYNSPITSAVGGSLGKFGAGTLILNNTATYDGITLINSGTLQVGNGGTTGSIPSNTNISDSGTLAWNRSDNYTLSGVISGSGAITKFSPGDLRLTGINTFTGNVTMNTATPVPSSGSITITNSSALGVGPKTITIIDNSPNNTASLQLDGSAGNINLASNISFTTSSNIGTGGIVNVAGDNVINGNFTLSSGGGSTQLTVQGGTLTLAAGATLTPNTTARHLILNGAANGNLNAAAKDQTQINFLSLDKLGAGTWTLAAANTYSGPTAISGGTLKIANVSALGTAVLTQPTTDNGTNISSTGTLDLNGLSNVNEVIRLNGTGLGGNGALVNSGAATTLGGTVASLTSAAVGTGLGTAPTVTITGGGGTGATATASLGVTVQSFTITGGTTVYSAAPTVAITAGGGAGATATAVLSGGTTGTVTGITITNAGTGFTSAPTIAFSGGTVTTAGTNPTGTGNATNFNLQGYTITNAGTGYTSAPTATFNTSTANNTAVTVQLAGVQLTGDSSIGGSGDITLQGPVIESGGPRALTKVGTNTLNLAGNNAFTGATTVSGGKLSVTGSIANSSGVTVNNAAATFEAASAQTVKALTVTAGQARVTNAVKIALTVGDGTQATSQLSLTGGKLDLTTNGLAIHYAAGNDAAVLASTRAQIIAGYNPSSPTAGDGTWNGTTGITSSSIGSLNAIGYALASDVLPFTNGTTDTFLGTTVDKNTVVARYTLSGDLNLDGSVDFLDLAKLAQSYNVTDGTRQWSTGDVNYDGNTDFLDLAKMAQNYNTALGAPAVPGASVDFNADLARAFAAVPEPGTISILGIGAVALLARRRNRRAA